MVTRYAIVALALFVILGEVRSLKCYVCTNCLIVPKVGSDFEERDNCSACVIEDKFVLERYVQTDRHCTQCPTKRLLVINDDISYYDCCSDDLCLGSERRAREEITPVAKTGDMHKETTVNKSVEVTTTKPDNSVTRSGVIAPSTQPTSERATENMDRLSAEKEPSSDLKPTLSTPPLDTAVRTNDPTTAEPTAVSEETKEIPGLKKEPDEDVMETQAVSATEETGISSTAIDHRSELNVQPSGAAVTPTTTARTNTAAKPEEITPGSPNVPSMESTPETATGNVGSSSNTHPETSVINPKLPKQPVGTDTTPDVSTTTNTISVTEGKAIPKDKIEDKHMEIPAETTTQNLESSSPTTCQTNVRYLAFSLSLICGFVACFN